MDRIKNGEIDLIINTPSGKKPKTDEVAIRTQAVVQNIPCITTLSGASAAVNGIESLLRKGISVNSIQEVQGSISPLSRPSSTAERRVAVKPSSSEASR